MSTKTDFLSRFSGAGDGHPLFVPDLTLWYDWHRGRGTLPGRWKDRPLADIARGLGVPIWLPVQPWRMETPGIEIVTTEHGDERLVRSETPAGTLIARWTLGPDGDWWQTEYPVKSGTDLAAVLELVRARSYVLDPSEVAGAGAAVGDDGLLALKLPRRPYSDLLHEFLGWSEGLMFLGEPAVHEIVAVLEAKLQRLVEEVAGLPGEIVFCPDNLDGQFISPRAFKKELTGSYRLTAETMHRRGKRIVVHVGGPIRHLVAPLAEAGVDGIEGIAGPPQGNATLAEARDLAGPGVTLWGGISQDFLTGTHERETFEAVVRQAVDETRGDGRMIVGVADRVPVDAEIERVEAIRSLVEQTS